MVTNPDYRGDVLKLSSAFYSMSLAFWQRCGVLRLVMKKQDTMDRNVASFGPIDLFNLFQEYIVACSIDCPSLVKKIDVYNTSSIPENGRKDFASRQSSFWLHGSCFIFQMPFHTRPLRFENIMVYSRFITCENTHQKCTPSATYQSKSLWEISFLTAFWLAFKIRGTHRAIIFRNCNLFSMIACTLP